MKALGASHFNFFVSRQRESSHEFRFLLHQKRVAYGVVLFRANLAISSASSSQKNLGNKAIQTVSLDQPKTVRVRFKLHKQCAFGQQFLVVGDDPNLGLWDPSSGVPLNWSEGHVWTAEVDVPCSKVVSYKFILEEIDGTISWQPGPDRFLETWDTAKTISVSEDWDSPDFQNVVEEETIVVDDLNESTFIAANWDQTSDVGEEEVDANVSSLLIAEDLNRGVVEEGNNVMKEELDVNECTSGHSDEPSMLMVAENITEEQDSSVAGEEEEETMLGDHGRMATNGSDSSTLKHETRLDIVEGFPVLVPGLATFPPEEVAAEEAEAEAKASSIVRSTTAVSDEIAEVTTTVFDEIEDSTYPKQKNNITVEDTATESDEIEDSSDLNPRNNNTVEDTTTESVETEGATTKLEIRVSAAQHHAEASEVTVVEEKLRLNNDRQWGRRALHKFLANLGFMQRN
ncbi:uncharacterized protein LOC131016578 [Salvia miltiorrhiza]|uniref:uncharacterized protein LOC131016578 n=1 Tax=Salvia miltiorrhiza TaxID=226208 RepID=UPI0025AC85E4|nr:uncharacterized protein LOC131016578 [Salvia miltiorrhiza]